MQRGDVYDADFPRAGRHPAVIVTRDEAIPVLSDVTVVLVTGTVREHPAEVLLGRESGLERDSAANCDQIFTLPKDFLGRRRGHLGPEALRRLDQALAVALGLS